MPSARARDGTRLRYEIAGGGLNAPAVLLVMGLAFRGEAWGETREVLAGAGYRTITMDNRGAGESTSARLIFNTSVMADDAMAVLEAAFVRRAHVVGVSLGGMVAQEIALRHEGRVGALVLQSTSAGRPRVDLVAPALPFRSAAMWQARLGDPSSERARRTALRVLTTRRYAKQADLGEPRIRALLDAVESGISVEGYLGQVGAAWRHRAWRRLSGITAPTLIQHGTRDGIVRAAAGRAMAARIPDCRLEIYPRAGHVLAIQVPESLSAVHRFLRAHDGRLAR
jgi:pimeloyl-ACP methyl ester carboxylesterase